MTQTSARAWGIGIILCFALPCGLLLTLWPWACWANNLSPYPVPSRPEPSPNGYALAGKLVARLPKEPEQRGQPYPLREARPILDGVRRSFRHGWLATRWVTGHERMPGSLGFPGCARFFV